MVGVVGDWMVVGSRDQEMNRAEIHHPNHPKGKIGTSNEQLWNIQQLLLSSGKREDKDI